MTKLVSVYIARWHQEAVEKIAAALEKEGIITFIVGHMRDTHIAVSESEMFRSFDIIKNLKL